MTRTVKTALRRIGRNTPVYEQSATGEDEFGQVTETWQQTDTVFVARSYQNRNTTLNASSGELNRDRPIFFFYPDEYPPSGARIKYEGEWYELDAVTPHDTHAVAPGQIVIEDSFPP